MLGARTDQMNRWT